MPPDLPSHFIQTIANLHGQPGQNWLDALPRLIAACERRWRITAEPPFPLSYHYVAPARRADGTEVVLKLGLPGDEHVNDQITALRLCDGQGMVRLLDADLEQGAMLLERLRPGTMLTELAFKDDEAATAIAADVMRRIWRPVPPDCPLPTVRDWTRELDDLRRKFGGGTGPIPARLVEQAESLFADLLASSESPVLLHGDLHHENILLAGADRWLAIDPHGVVGEPGFEVGSLLRNPLPQVYEWPDLPRITTRRLDQLSDLLGLDRQRLAAWALAAAILSVAWDVLEGGPHVDGGIRIAAILSDLVG